jgi:predicted nucleic acid-binding protein
MYPILGLSAVGSSSQANIPAGPIRGADGAHCNPRPLTGRPRPVNDTWVAACCLAYDLPLATLNVKDFADFAEHDGLELITSQ